MTTDIRQTVLQSWLKKQLGDCTLQAMQGDASFRRYFRIHHAGSSYVAMDAPPDKENCLPFIAIANALREKGLCTPEIIASDLSQGFLLLTDFGNQLYLTTLSDTIQAESLYGIALDALAVLRTQKNIADWQLPHFTQNFMRNELELFKEWFLLKYLQITLTTQDEKKLNDCFDFLAIFASQQPQVFMHRDYHSANLMILPNHQVGILDFQDACIGPVTYDLVSLLRDCYIDWPETTVIHLVSRYYEQLTDLRSTPAEFLQWFDLMGIQRHLKALLTFSRKYCRDNNANYLQHIPRTLNYILSIGERYSECAFLCRFMKDNVLEKVAITCAG